MRSRHGWRPKSFGLPVKVKNQAIDIPGWAKIRDAILKRDGGACRICHDEGGFAALNVHHIDWDRRHNQSENLVTLCRDCHRSVHQEGYKPELFEDWPEPWGAHPLENQE